MSEPKQTNPAPAEPQAATPAGTAPDPSPDTSAAASTRPRPKEIGGPQGPEPTRYGDWEKNGRVSDF